MQVAPGIFKSYDIRGIYGQDLFDETALAVSKAMVKFLSPKKIIVGTDGRVSGPALKSNMLQGFTALGVDVVDVGMVSTDMFYFACASEDLPGVMITASHNPKEYNGFKIVKKIPYLLSGDDGIQDIRQIIEKDDFPPESDKKGQVSTLQVMPKYIDKILSLIPDPKSIKPFKVVVDTANGMVGPSFTELSKKLPQLTVVPMYFEPDGNFPNHGGDPLQEENRRELQERVVTEKADLGFAFDPDGDRFFCIDKTGRFVPGDYMTALLSKHFLKLKPGSNVVYDLRASDAVPDGVKEMGGNPLINKVGHSHIKKRMMDENAIFGGEVSGHYYFADFFYCDSGLAPALTLLDLLSHSGSTLDQLVDELENKYFISGEINTKGVDSNSVFQKLKDKYSADSSENLELDGVSFRFKDWHFNVRASNTEPLVRLCLEANSKELMEEKRDEVLNIIRS